MTEPRIAGAPRGRTLAARARGRDRWLGWGLALAFALLVIGLLRPTVTIQTMLFLHERISILDGLAVLFADGNYGLFAIIVVFSVIFPLTKLVVATLLWFRADIEDARTQRILAWLETLGKWSMLDVFVVALLVVATSLSMFSNVTVHEGIYLFATSILLSLYALTRIRRLAVH